MVIAHLEPRDAHHREATSYLREHADVRLVMHSSTLATFDDNLAAAARKRGLMVAPTDQSY